MDILQNIASRVAFSLFGVEIFWYGIIITAAIIVSFIGMCIILKKQGKSIDDVLDLAIAVVPLAILSARLFSVLFDDNLSLAEFFQFRDGGMSIIGAIIGGVVGIVLYCGIKKKNFLDIADFIAPFLILSQAIGRWGNYFNQELYGNIITNPSFQWFPLAVFIESEGAWFQALFFYEFVLDLVGALLLFTFFFKLKKRGVVTATYLMFYGLARFFLEDFRQSEYILKWGSVHVSKLVSILMFACGLALLIFIFVRKKKQKAVVIGGDENV